MMMTTTMMILMLMTRDVDAADYDDDVGKHEDYDGNDVDVVACSCTGYRWQRRSC